jgi:Protein of unknown function (DUF1501)
MKTRRVFLRSSLGLAVAAMATGLAPRILRDEIIPEASGETLIPPSILFLATSSRGDPLNACTPGSYVTGTIRGADPELAATDVDLGGKLSKGALLWSQLPANLRARLAFIHHRTGAVAHSDYDRVMRLQGAVKTPQGNGEEMLPTALAQELHKALGTLQPDPICLGEERMTSGGAPLTPLQPSALKALFSAAPSVLDDLRTLRDAKVDAMYATLKASGTRAQRAFFDDYVISRERARQLGIDLGNLLAELPADPEVIDGAADQIVAAVALAKLKVAPVITLHVPFGGDNHKDPNFSTETEETIAGVAHLAKLWERLTTHNLTENVTFGMYNMFGRTLDSQNGRSHNPDHNVLVMFGPGVRGGVGGGLDDKLLATDIDPATGESKAGAAIAASDSAAAAGATLMVAAGVTRQAAIVRIPEGKPIDALVI